MYQISVIRLKGFCIYMIPVYSDTGCQNRNGEVLFSTALITDQPAVVARFSADSSFEVTRKAIRVL